MRRALISLFFTLVSLAVSNTVASEKMGPEEVPAITNEDILRSAWRQGGATPEIILEVVNNNEEWAEIVAFATKSGTIPARKLELLREKLRAREYTEVVFSPDTLLEWVWGRGEDGLGFALRGVRVQREQEAYRLDLDDGYVVYLLAKCFNFTLASRLEATIETEAPVPPTPITWALNVPELEIPPPALRDDPPKKEKNESGEGRFFCLQGGGIAVCGLPVVYAIGKLAFGGGGRHGKRGGPGMGPP